MTGKDKYDIELENYLDGSDGLTNAYHQDAKGMSPIHADEAILAASRKAIGTGPASVKPIFSEKWHVPVSIAAVVVLSVLVVFNLPNESQRVLYEPVIEESNSNSVLQKADSFERNESIGQEISVNEVEMILDSTSLQDTRSQRAQSAELSELMAMERMTMDEIIPVDEVSGEALQQFIAPEMDFANPRPATSDSQILGDPVSISINQTANMDDGSDVMQRAETAQRRQSAIECTTPRPEECAEIYMPVCAVRDTGIRCVTSPCDSTEQVDYSNACSACRDPEVLSYTEGQCLVPEPSEL